MGPAVVAIHAIALHAGIQLVTDRLYHRVRHGHMQLAAATLQLDLERGYDHDLGRTDDIGDVRVDLRIQVLEFDVGDDIPGLGKVGERLAQHHLDDAALGHGEFAPFYLGVAAAAAEEIVDHGEHQGRVQHQQCRTAQRIELDQVQARGQVQVLRVFAELLHPHRRDADLGRAANHVEQSDAKLAREAIVDHLERRHAAAYQPHLGGDVEHPYLTGRGL